MSIRQRQLNELKQSGQVAKFTLRTGRYIFGTVQDFDDKDIVIVTRDGKRTIALATVEEISVRAPSRPASPQSSTSTPLGVAGGDLYLRAKRAEAQRDFDTAERYYREAIQRDDRAESAAKDLASLLNRLNRIDEAIQTLEDFLRQHQITGNLTSFYNQMIDLYQRASYYERAIELIDSTLDYLLPERRPAALRKKAFCQMQLGQLEEAEKTLQKILRSSPSDGIARRWLDSIQEAIRSGDRSAFMLNEARNELWEMGVSPFLRFYMDRCTYEGIPDEQRATGNFAEEDYRKLRGLIDSAGQRRPSQRAELYLTQAVVAERLEKESREILASLHRYALNMAEASAVEGKHPDVIGTYVSCAVATATKMHTDLERHVTDHLSRLCKVKHAGLASALRHVVTSRNRIAFDWLLETSLSAQIITSSVLKVAEEETIRDRSIELCLEYNVTLAEASTVQSAWLSASREVSRQRQRVHQEFDFLRKQVADLNTIDDQRAQLSELHSYIRGALDQERLQHIMEIQEQVSSYMKQNAYVERERLAYIVAEAGIPELLRDFEANPTTYSIEQFYSYLEALKEALKEHFGRIQQQAEPQELKYELAVEHYPDKDEIECQIAISNAEGKSPVSELVVHIAPSPNDEYQVVRHSVPLNVTLHGGHSYTCQVPVRLTEVARAAQVLTLHFDLSFVTRSGHKVSQTGLTLPIRLYNAENFQEIQNPYIYANGSLVADGKMFYGRDRLIENLFRAIISAPAGKSVVIFGQKRTGKSSVLYHLAQWLSGYSFIPIRFSVGDIVELSVKAFLFRIIQVTSSTLAERFPQLEDMQRPSLSSLAESPELVFHDYMEHTLRRLKSLQHDARLVLMLDEFSYMYSAIRAGTLSPNFMRFWKALVERGYFSTVLVGQDSMLRFIEEFPNELQVAQPERVTYLAKEDARRLIEEPIQVPETGESRYRGRAVERLFELTAGSPYYIQIFCNRLVEYMNSNRVIYITEADIERVKQDLLRGPNALNSGQFDNLLSSADSHTDAISAKDAQAVLTEIAKRTRSQNFCKATDIRVEASKPVSMILEDLVRREVLEKQNDAYRIRVGLFKEWLLEN